MKKYSSIKIGLLIGITFLLILSTIIPIVIGNNVKNYNKTTITDNDYCYHISEISDFMYQINESENTLKQLYSSPIDSAWPMKCHDLHHTGRSPYGTANNTYYELWNYKYDDQVDTDPVIGEDGTIYVGGSFDDMIHCLIAINPNGTLKWRYKSGMLWNMCPSIAEDGTIYFGSWDKHLHAVNPDGTRKWRFNTNDNIDSDPTIGEDGTIYFGVIGPGSKGRIYAINPDGTEQWHYDTGDWIYSDPAIGDDGTIYIGSDDNYFYAMNPNGTLKWRFKTKDYIHGSPSIADDGTIYIASLDDYLYALYPNGSLRWKTNIVYGSDTNPSLAEDGTIYVSSGNWLFAINPDDGSKKWEVNLGGSVWRSSSAVCADGIIYTGTIIGGGVGGEIVAVNPDGTLRWKKRISNKVADSSPCISKDGIIYIQSSNVGSGRLHAFGSGGMVEADAHGPYYGLIDTPLNFSGSALYGYKPYTWFWNFDDGHTSDEQNPSHTYDNPGNYTITLTVTDKSGNISEDTAWAWVQYGNNPPDKPSIDGPREGIMGIKYDYKFNTTDPEGLNVWYYIDWGDGENTGWIGPYKSGKTITQSNAWGSTGDFTIKCKSKDIYNDESDWSEFEITIPRNRITSYEWYVWFLEHFPILERLLNLI